MKSYIHTYTHILYSYIHTHKHTHIINFYIPSTKPQCLAHTRCSRNIHSMTKPFKERSVITKNANPCSHFQLSGGENENKQKGWWNEFFTKLASFHLGIVFYFENCFLPKCLVLKCLYHLCYDGDSI